jgi:2-oxoglutarate dehydrogenase E1 component
VPNQIDPTVLAAYRHWGYLQADLDWLGRLEPLPHSELDVDAPGVETARRWYCGTLAAEFMHIPDPERRRWVQEAMEGDVPEPPRRQVLEQLIRAATFEELLQTRYLGNKRFSIEGAEALIPLLTEMLERAGEHPTRQAVLAMSHRGRLNVMAHVVGVGRSDLFAGFEDVDPRSIMGAGDVKYHLGATGTHRARSGREISLHLVSNPSHLEAVNPVATGRVRAKQTRLGDSTGEQVVLILMHGDAAFAGQGITSETLNMADVDGFSIGGTVHVVVNNWIGFTAEPHALHSTRFSSDAAKRLAIPIFHVNGEDPEAVVRAAHLAVAYRYRFSSDVVVDLIGYRRHGHSEIDDPTVTQPVLYRTIQARDRLWQLYARSIGVSEEETGALARGIRDELSGEKSEAEQLTEIPLLRTLPSYWDDYVGGVYSTAREVDTGIAPELVRTLAEALTTTPDDFNVHPKVAKLLETRAQMGRGEKRIDFGMAEALAFASLLREGRSVRLSGQDSRRGTFNHRHAVLLDAESGEPFAPLSQLTGDDTRFDVYDSVLSEAAVLGFEYGYSRDYPETLVCWEAQFGDFANGAQTIFDQFVTAGEDKWGLLSGLVVLLPHGFEGQGPEHSSARIERFLQLAAEDAIQVAQPSTSAQYFHLLRRQSLRKWVKPLIVFTPKSMLRHPGATSPVEAFSRKRFLPVLPEDEVNEASRILLCTGKIAHELRAERKKRGDESTAIVTVEQLYPFPADELTAALDQFPSARDLRWVQEEPANMGALFFVMPRLERLTRGRHVRSIKRSASASPATGSAKAHRLEQQTLVDLAFG